MALAYTDLPADLVFIRHGESEGNVTEKLPVLRPLIADKTRFNYRLTFRGVKQARKTGEWFQKHGISAFDAYFTSDLPRTKETAALLGYPGASWMEETDLREQHLHDAKGENPEVDVVTLRSINVEHFLSLLMRMWAGKKVLVVCHATIIRSFIIRLERLTYADKDAVADKTRMIIKNCHVLWYTRRSPDDRGLHRELAWRKMLVPYKSTDEELAAVPWSSVVRKTLTNEQLLIEVEKKTPLLISRDDIEKAQQEEEEASIGAACSSSWDPELDRYMQQLFLSLES
jgi:broad specificity phosphatase PhoE